MTTYNGARFLSKQLDSILIQTVLPSEIIVVDDCSTDNSVEVLKYYQNKFSFIKIFINENNLGPTKSFERAVNLCECEFIVLSDQDDVWFSNKLEVLINNIGTAMLIHHDAYLINDSGEKIDSSLLKFIDYKPIPTFFMRLMREGVHGCCLMMRREVACAARNIPHGFIYHDFFYNLVACSLGNVKTLYIPLMSYRLHDGNACGLFSEKSFERAMMDYEKNLNNMKLIANLKIFERYKQDIDFYVAYYNDIVFGHSSTTKFILKTIKLLGFKHGIALIVNNLFGNSGLRYIYNIINK